MLNPILKVPPLLSPSKATEDFMVHLFEDCNLCAIHAKRVTISESGEWGGIWKGGGERGGIWVLRSGCPLHSASLTFTTSPPPPLQCPRTSSWHAESVGLSMGCPASSRARPQAECGAFKYPQTCLRPYIWRPFSSNVQLLNRLIAYNPSLERFLLAGILGCSKG